MSTPASPDRGPKPVRPTVGEPDPVEEERRDWLKSLDIPDADDVLFQFETLLKAMDRFFNLDNHPDRRSGGIGMEDNLRIEIGVADRRFRNLLKLVEGILSQSDTSAFLFQSYVETQLVTDLERDALLERHRVQHTPQESLYLLQAGLRSLVQLTTGLLKADAIAVPTFRAVGHQYTALMLQNRYFNPLRNRNWNPLYDSIEHSLLHRSVRNAPSENLRRGLSLIILILNRYLKVCRWIRPNAAGREDLHDALPALAFLRSEFRSLVPWLEETFPGRMFPEGPQSPTEEHFLDQVDALAFQLGMESRKVFGQLLLDFNVARSVNKLRSGLEAAHGLLNTFLEQAIVNLVKPVLPDVQGKDLFPDFISRFEQSKRLREDLWIFHEVMDHVIGALGSERNDPLTKRIKYQMLVEFVNYFENLTFQLVRQSDHETFESFFKEVRELKGETFTNPNRNREIVRPFEHFRIFLETTLGHVNQRIDLQGVPLDEDHANSILNQFIRDV